MKYTSNNGYTGTFKKDNFYGYEHYDLCIYKDNKLVFHASYSEPKSYEELVEEVEDFPNFYKAILSLSWKGDS